MKCPLVDRAGIEKINFFSSSKLKIKNKVEIGGREATITSEGRERRGRRLRIFETRRNRVQLQIIKSNNKTIEGPKMATLIVVNNILSLDCNCCVDILLLCS
jgi:hypothetical protein